MLQATPSVRSVPGLTHYFGPASGRGEGGHMRAWVNVASCVCVARCHGEGPFLCSAPHWAEWTISRAGAHSRFLGRPPKSRVRQDSFGHIRSWHQRQTYRCHVRSARTHPLPIRARRASVQFAIPRRIPRHRPGAGRLPHPVRSIRSACHHEKCCAILAHRPVHIEKDRR